MGQDVQAAAGGPEDTTWTGHNQGEHLVTVSESALTQGVDERTARRRAAPAEAILTLAYKMLIEY